jgi:hypothetical protein
VVFWVVDIEVHFLFKILLDFLIGKKGTCLKVEHMVMYTFQNTQYNTKPHKLEHINFLEECLMLGNNLAQGHESIKLAVQENKQILIDGFGLVGLRIQQDILFELS